MVEDNESSAGTSNFRHENFGRIQRHNFVSEGTRLEFLVYSLIFQGSFDAVRPQSAGDAKKAGWEASRRRARPIEIQKGNV